MVTSQATKLALTQSEIMDLLDEAGLIQRDDLADQSLIENTRLGLERVRLLRSFERDGIAFYELTHDHLAARVAQRIGEAERETKRAHELLRREMDNWYSLRKLIEPTGLILLYDQLGVLRRLKPEQFALLLISSVHTGNRKMAGNWMIQIKELDKTSRQKAFQFLVEASRDIEVPLVNIGSEKRIVEQRYFSVSDSALRSLILLQGEDILSEEDPGYTSVTLPDDQRYSLKTIHKLLNAGFSSEEITRLCYDYFPLAYYSMSDKMGKGDKIMTLIQYCEEFNEFTVLLEVIRDGNPAQYARFESALLPTSQQRLPTLSEPSNQTLRESIDEILRRFFSYDSVVDLSFEFNLGYGYGILESKVRSKGLAEAILEESSEGLLWDILVGAIKTYRPFLLHEFQINPPIQLERAKLRNVAQKLPDWELQEIAHELDIPGDIRELLDKQGRRRFAFELVKLLERQDRLEYLTVLLAYTAPGWFDVPILTSLKKLMEKHFDEEDLLILAFDLEQPRYVLSPYFLKSQIIDTIVETISEAQKLPTLVKAVIHPKSFPNVRPAVVLRRLAAQAITSSTELDELVYDFFRPVYHKFASGTKFSIKLKLLIEYGEQQWNLSKLALLLIFDPEWSDLSILPTSHTAVIRQLLKKSLNNDEELTQFCFDCFRDVFDEFSTEQNYRTKLQNLIDRCEMREQRSELLQLIGQLDPAKFHDNYLRRFDNRSNIISPQKMRDVYQQFLAGEELIAGLANTCPEIVEIATFQTLEINFNSIKASTLSERSRRLYRKLTRAGPQLLEKFLRIVFGEPAEV